MVIQLDMPEKEQNNIENTNVAAQRQGWVCLHDEGKSRLCSTHVKLHNAVRPLQDTGRCNDMPL